MNFFKRVAKSVSSGVAALDPTSSKSLKERGKELGHAIETIHTGGLIDTGPASQAARWVDPSTKAGRLHLAVVGVSAATVAASVVTAGAAAPAGTATIAAMLAAGTAGALQAGAKIASIDAAENAKRKTDREAAAAAAPGARVDDTGAAYVGGKPVYQQQRSNPSEPPTFRQWLAHFFVR